MEKVLEILEELRPDVDFENEDSLVDGGVLDSFDIVALVGELNDEFDIEIKPSDLVPANFNSAKAISDLVEKLMDE
jgi:acyl carrier protein